MGGCRCTYRNCVVKTDGKTHMFHYPVFEKVRCHQWLVNAQKLEFLNLKVSQLKNRVVCQHHFKIENFMNYKKDKLTFDAIPTENGPFCDPSKFLEHQEIIKEYPDIILLEDIENGFIFNDKKANFSLKYGDFLTNNEIIDSSSHYTPKNINIKNENTIINLNSRLCCNNDKTILEPNFRSHGTKLLLPIKNTKMSQPMLVVPPYSKLNNELKTCNKQNLIHVLHTDQVIQDIHSQNNHVDLHLKNINSTAEVSNRTSTQTEPKVKIISEKRICGPIEITGKLEKISPSETLNLSDKFPVAKVEYDVESDKKSSVEEVNSKPSNKLKILEVLDVEFDLSQPKSDSGQKGNSKISTDKLIDVQTQSPSKKQVQIKNKVTPERIAAIEKKRIFNMKLKNVIESCLDKLDDPVKSGEIEATSSNTHESDPKIHNINSIIKKTDEQFASHFVKTQTVESIDDKTIAYFEARMKKMEHTILNKIEQNTQRIMELKNSFGKATKRKEPSQNKCVSVQTNTNQNSYKKFLYQEISKYLSQTANNLIYEELFINQFSLDESKSLLKRKRRKCI